MGWQQRPPIKLSASEKRELEHLAHAYTQPFARVIRARVVLLAASCVATGTIAEKVGIPRQVVLRWIVRFGAERLAGLADRPRPGRPHRV